jgi:hypothetical protein
MPAGGVARQSRQQTIRTGDRPSSATGAAAMDDALAVHRLHFAFTVTYHYLFPQLTMGLGLLIVVLKSMALWKNDEAWNQSARFWARIFGINFVLGVVTGIPWGCSYSARNASGSGATGPRRSSCFSAPGYPDSSLS